MKKIAFDFMGNDNGPDAAVEASIEFANKNKDYKIFLVGNRDRINPELLIKLPNNVEIVDEKNEVDKNLSIRQAISSPNSMNVALQMAKDQKVDGVLSSGDSGLYIASASLILRRIEGISRVAFMPMIPKFEDNKYFLLLDVGANVEVKANYLYEWAKMGSLFYKALFNNPDPKIALLNIGTEDYKGMDFHREAHEFLKNDPKLQYQGFIEPKYIIESNIDVIVSDGYAGNITLKTMEGTMLTFGKLIKQKITKNWFRKIWALMLKPSFKEIKEKFDYRNVGGAWVVGLNGTVLKAHGSSDVKAYLGALQQMKIALDFNILEQIKKEIASTKDQEEK